MTSAFSTLTKGQGHTTIKGHRRGGVCVLWMLLVFYNFFLSMMHLVPSKMSFTFDSFNNIYDEIDVNLFVLTEAIQGFVCNQPGDCGKDLKCDEDNICSKFLLYQLKTKS